MTRCTPLYKLAKKFRHDEAKLAAICQKEESTIRQIYAYVDWMDANFPGWDEKPDAKPPISEKASRPLRAISDPGTAQICLEATKKTLESRKDPFTGEFVKNPGTKRTVERVIARTMREQRGGTIIVDNIPTTNVWQWRDIDPRFGQPYPGRIPGQLVIAALTYWAKPACLVVDPMAGGGTTHDVCEVLGYPSLSYDLHPCRPFIKKHDLTRGLPQEAFGCGFIFFDPPYWRLMAKDYAQDSISALSYEQFIQAMERCARYFSQALKPGGVAVLLMQDVMKGENELDQELEKLGVEYLPLSFDSFVAFRDYLKPICRVQVPQPLGGTVHFRQQATLSIGKRPINVARDMWVFRND